MLSSSHSRARGGGCVGAGMSSSFGYEASREIIADDDLPVDIHHRKFAQWLVDRRKAPKDWHDKLQAILLKVDALARNLPATLTRCTGECVPDPHILAPSDGVEPVRWDYYRARLVRDKIIAGASTVKDATNDAESALSGAFSGADTAVHDASKETTETRTRGLFGRLAGKAREWDDIVRMYERDNIHLAEAQMTMNQLVDYDIPHHKSHAQRRGKQLADLERRESEHRRAAVVAAERFIATCTDVGVSPLDATCAGGEGFAAALDRRLSDRLDTIFAECAAAARTDAVGEAMEHYAQWTRWAHGIDAAGIDGGLLPSLACIRGYEDGDLLLSDDDEDDIAEIAVVGVPVAGGDDDDDELEGFPGASGKEAAAAVPAGDAPKEGGIDWDIGAQSTPTEGGESPGGESPGGPVSIDWDIGDVVVERVGGGESITDVPIADVPIASASSSPDSAVPREGEIKPQPRLFHAKLARQAFRAAFVDDLLELRAFLSQRSADVRHKECAALLASAPASIAAYQSCDALTKLAELVWRPVAVLREPSALRSLMIRTSGRYKSRLVMDLEHKAGAEGRSLKMRTDAEAKKAECRLELARCNARLDECRRALREVKVSIECAVSKMFKGRRVNVMGEIGNAIEK